MKQGFKTLDNVEVFAGGTWKSQDGTVTTFTDKDLDDMVHNYVDNAPLKVGHSTDTFNMQVAKALGVPEEMIKGDKGQGAVGLGGMTALRRMGDKLIAGFKNVPEKVADLITNRFYKSVSAELARTPSGYAIRGVALLGAQQPAVESLENRLSEALVYSYSMAQPTVADVTPVIGGKNKKQEFNSMPDNGITPGAAANDNNPSVPENNENQNTSGGEVMEAIATELGLDPKTATGEQILESIKALKTGSATAANSATGPLMSKLNEATAMVQVAQSQVKTLEDKVHVLERANRILNFTKRAESNRWSAFVKDVEVEVSKIADMPADVAENIAGSYDHAFEVMKNTQFFERVGPAVKDKEVPVHEFDAKVRKYATDNHVDYYVALNKFAAEDAKGYQSFMEFARNNQFANVVQPSESFAGHPQVLTKPVAK